MTSNKLANALLSFCICTFVVYQMQEGALERMDKLNHIKPPQPMLSTFQIKHDEEEQNEIFESKEASKKVWITMGLCWSGNTKFHGKEGFPYKEAVKYSSRLWHHLTEAKVILQVVYSEDEVSQELREYQKLLQSFGVNVKLIPSEGVECVLKSQLIRLLAFQLPEVK